MINNKQHWDFAGQTFLVFFLVLMFNVFFYWGQVGYLYLSLIHRYSTLFIILHVVFVWIVIDVIFSKTSFIGFSLSHSKQNKQK